MRVIQPPQPNARYTRRELALMLGYSVHSMPVFERKHGLRRIRTRGRVEFWGAEILNKLRDEFAAPVETAASRRRKCEAVVQRLKSVR